MLAHEPHQHTAAFRQHDNQKTQHLIVIIQGSRRRRLSRRLVLRACMRLLLGRSAAANLGGLAPVRPRQIVALHEAVIPLPRRGLRDVCQVKSWLYYGPDSGPELRMQSATLRRAWWSCRIAAGMPVAIWDDRPGNY